MAETLIIEDGTIVANAQSFVTVTECRAFCDPRNLELPTEDADVEALLLEASDFLFSLENDFQGTRTDAAAQVLPFPRQFVALYSVEIDTDVIPQILKDAQCRLAFDAVEDDLLATGSGRVIKKEGVGPLQTEFSEDGASNPQVNLTAALNILKPLFKSSSNAGGGNINVCVDR